MSEFKYPLPDKLILFVFFSSTHLLTDARNKKKNTEKVNNQLVIDIPINSPPAINLKR